jgi:ubiquinone/menaquinone biosynthesis C-methylase UbiE
LNGHGLAGLRDRSFDVVYCINALPHLDEMDRWEYIREAFRVLRPGGRILIDSLDLSSDAGWATFVSNANQLKNFERPPYMPRFSTAEELTTYFSRAGFERVSVHRDRPPLVVVTGFKPAAATGQAGVG